MDAFSDHRETEGHRQSEPEGRVEPQEPPTPKSDEWEVSVIVGPRCPSQVNKDPDRTRNKVTLVPPLSANHPKGWVHVGSRPQSTDK
jgi:hypothetical protein